jgi:hypothetical protein
MIRWSGWEFQLWREFSVPMPNGCRPEKTATVWGTKAKPSVSAQAPAALLSLHNATGLSFV